MQVHNGKVEISRINLDKPIPADWKDPLPFKILPRKGWVLTTAPTPPPPPPPPDAPQDQPVTHTDYKKPVREQSGWHRSYEMEFLGARVEVRTSDGWLVGFDGGEWGGGLYWFNATGTKHYQIVTDKPMGWFDPQNVRDLLPFQGGVLAVQGLAHLGLDGGKVEKVTRDRDGKWKATLLVDLGSAPQVCLDDGDGRWIIFTSDGAVRVHADGALDKLGEFPFAGWLYPNSIARAADGTLYLGMRHFVARLIPDGQHYQAELMVPTSLPLFDPDPAEDVPSGEVDARH